MSDGMAKSSGAKPDRVRRPSSKQNSARGKSSKDLTEKKRKKEGAPAAPSDLGPIAEFPGSDSDRRAVPPVDIGGVGEADDLDMEEQLRLSHVEIAECHVQITKLEDVIASLREENARLLAKGVSAHLPTGGDAYHAGASDAEKAADAAPLSQLDADRRLLERLTMLMAPLAEAARVEREHERAERALNAAYDALTPPEATPGAPAPSFFAQFAGLGGAGFGSGGGASLDDPHAPRRPSLAAAVPNVIVAFTRTENTRLRGELTTALSEIGGLVEHDSGLRARLGRVRKLIPSHLLQKNAELARLLGDVPLPIARPKSLLEAKDKMGVTKTLLKWNATETDDSLRNREMKGEGLSNLPHAPAGTIDQSQRAAADLVFGSLRRAPSKKMSLHWAKTLSLAQKRAGISRVSDPDEVSYTTNYQAPKARPLRLCGKAKHARRRWAKVAALALKGRWSPRPDDLGDKAAHAGKHADGFPALSDPFGLIEDEDDDDEDEEEESDAEEEADPMGRGHFTVAVEDDDDEEEDGAHADGDAGDVEAGGGGEGARRVNVYGDPIDE